jgi:uncharacterized protein YndB with AHSA1/START domain
MATTESSAEIRASPERVYEFLSDTSRLPEWNVSYDHPHPLADVHAESSAFDAHRVLANRSMRLICSVTQADPGRVFAFDCHGEEGEIAREIFELAPTPNDQGTKLRWHSELTLSGEFDPLKEVSELTYTQAWVAATVDQSLAKLQQMLGTPSSDTTIARDSPEQPEAQ